MQLSVIGRINCELELKFQHLEWKKKKMLTHNCDGLLSKETGFTIMDGIIFTKEANCFVVTIALLLIFQRSCGVKIKERNFPEKINYLDLHIFFQRGRNPFI